ncbi:MAG: RluA family pseudouridine synthase [Alphaproteobacteria bacterium]|nr:RluA family pseudouridine synthase [Alphaproteobacteria bacterium]
MIVEITASEVGKRIDVAISKLVPEISRTQIQKLIKAKKVVCENDVVLDASKKITAPCVIEVKDCTPEHDYKIIPEKIDLDIIYEDEFILVVNKPAGMVCHPAPGHKSGTLVNAVAHHCNNRLSNVGGIMRPGVVHRLDKDTSGLMLIAKTNEAHVAFANLFANEKGNLIKRKYICFVYGVPSSKSGKIETFITRHPKNRQIFIAHTNTGKHAVTLYNVEKSVYFTSTKAISKVTCELLTGRTHQIRVHMRHIGCNIIGDQIYGKSKIEPTYPDIICNFSRQALHSQMLEFQHPFTQKWLSFNTNLPEDMLKIEKTFKA